MASTYTDLKVELIGTGEQSGSWGTTTNTNIGTALEEAIVGTVDVAFSSGTVTLTLSNSNATQSARHLRLNLTGTSGGAQNLVVPAIQKNYLVNNGTADTITVKTPSGSGIGVPSGKTMWVYNNGSNVVDAVTAVTSLQSDGGVTVDNITIDGTEIDLSSGDLTLDVAGDIVLDAAGDEVIFKDGSTNVGHVSMDSDNLTIKSLVSDKDVIFQGNDGGSGITALTLDMSAAGEATFNAGITSPGTVTSSGTLAVTGNLTVDGASGSSGQVLTSAGSGSTPTWGDAFVSGMIMLWSGSTGSIPSGWVLCNGSNSTPDLRNRFVVGAGNTYSVDATGGSADATIPTHTHSATSSVSDSGHAHSSNVFRYSDEAGTNPSAANSGTASGKIFAAGNTGTHDMVSTSTATTGISVSTSVANAGSSGTNANLPPYYALAYIMKT
jgi:microcystin-dependent protein